MSESVVSVVLAEAIVSKNAIESTVQSSDCELPFNEE